MKTTTIQNRLNKRYTGSKNARGYQIVNDIIDTRSKSMHVTSKGEIIIKPCYTSGSGRFTKNMDYTSEVTRLLDLIGVKYITGNDAPRGSATGKWIKITTKIEH